MNLRYIHIGPSMERTPNEYRYEFELRTRFISNYFSRAIRTYRFATDGTFRMIGISLVNDNPEDSKLVPLDCLRVQILYDRFKYEEIKGTPACEYYLRLFQEGFKKAAKFKEIPLETLLGIVEEFRAGGCKNEWRHKKKLFRELDISVALDCYFTTNDFRLVATIEQISTKRILCSGVLLQTDPDEICFQGQFKDILIRGNRIIITDGGDSQRFLIDLEQAKSGVFSFRRYDILSASYKP